MSGEKQHDDKDQDKEPEELTLSLEDATEVLAGLEVPGWTGAVQEAMGTAASWQVGEDNDYGLSLLSCLVFSYLLTFSSLQFSCLVLSCLVLSSVVACSGVRGDVVLLLNDITDSEKNLLTESEKE